MCLRGQPEDLPRATRPGPARLAAALPACHHERVRYPSLTALGCLAALATALACAGNPRPPTATPASAPVPTPVRAAAPPTPADAGVASDAGIASDAGVSTATAPVGPEDDGLLIHPTEIEDPSGKALSHFHRALQRAARGEGKARIAFYGASHVAADLFTEVIRDRLQARFGDGGPGALMPAKPWPWHRHAAAEYLRQRALRPRRVKARKVRDDDYGLMGVAFASGKLRAIARLRTRAHGDEDGSVDSLELYYLKQPGGGRVRVLIDGKGVRTLRTDAKRSSPAYARFDVPLGQHEIELRTQADGPVRIFSIIGERSGPGVVLDTLGIPGARARYHLQWNDPIYAAHLARRDPDLVVLAYGTNESGDDDVPIATYEGRLRKVLKRVRAIVPEASCLLVGPSDRPTRLPQEHEAEARQKQSKKAGTEAKAEVKAKAGADPGADTDAPDDESEPFAPRPRTMEIVDAQRRVSADFGCGFFDLVAFMGGPMSMLRWVAADPRLGANDYVHFTRTGYEALGARLHQALMAGYVDPPDATRQGSDEAGGATAADGSAATGTGGAVLRAAPGGLQTP